MDRLEDALSQPFLAYRSVIALDMGILLRLDYRCKIQNLISGRLQNDMELRCQFCITIDFQSGHAEMRLRPVKARGPVRSNTSRNAANYNLSPLQSRSDIDHDDVG